MMSKNFNHYVEHNANVVKLIRMVDKNRDNVLEPTEIRELLTVSIHI